MKALLQFSRPWDWLNGLIGKYVIWLILASTVISGINAVVRKAFNVGSNAFLEVQWYLFAASFLIASAYTCSTANTWKIDGSTAGFQAHPDLHRHLWLPVLPHPRVRGLFWTYGIPFFVKGFQSGEMSTNAGGLIRWPVYALIPLGFSLLLLQGWSELIKRVAFLMGPDRRPHRQGSRHDR